MDIVVIGGPHSGVGKTLAAQIAVDELRDFKCGALKLTVADGERDPHDHGASAAMLAESTGICGRGASCGVCETVSAKIPSRLVVSDAAIHKKGTDTWRLSCSGAVAVAWVITLRSAAPAAVAAGLGYLQRSGAQGAVIEGTTALQWLQPRASVMVTANPGRAWKQVARGCIGSCDIVLCNRLPCPAGDVAPPQEFFAAAAVPCDLSDRTDAGTQWYRERLRQLWAGSASPVGALMTSPPPVANAKKTAR